jgi:hypothetical protein
VVIEGGIVDDAEHDDRRGRTCAAQRRDAGAP